MTHATRIARAVQAIRDALAGHDLSDIKYTIVVSARESGPLVRAVYTREDGRRESLSPARLSPKEPTMPNDPAKDNANKRKQIEGLPEDTPIPPRDPNHPNFPDDDSEVPEDEWTLWTGKKLALELMNGPDFAKVLGWFASGYKGTFIETAVQVRVFEGGL